MDFNLNEINIKQLDAICYNDGKKKERYIIDLFGIFIEKNNKVQCFKDFGVYVRQQW